MLTDRNSLLLLNLADEADRPVATLDIGPAAHCVAFGPGETLFVGFNGGPDHYSLRRYEHRGGSLVEAGVVAPSYVSKWPDMFPAATPMVVGPRGEIWFATDLCGKLLSLDPRSDKVRERGVPPWRTVALGFGPRGTLYTVGSSEAAGDARISTFRVFGQRIEPLGKIPLRAAAFCGCQRDDLGPLARRRRWRVRAGGGGRLPEGLASIGDQEN